MGNLEPCHYYQLTAYGWFGPEGAPNTHARIGLDALGQLADQYSVDVSKHPAPPYNEGVGDDPKTARSTQPRQTTVAADAPVAPIEPLVGKAS